MKTSENRKAFCFQSVEKECIGNKWIKRSKFVSIRCEDYCFLKMLSMLDLNLIWIQPLQIYYFRKDLTTVKHGTFHKVL